ncbi:hypothetical protein [Natronococcus occultus]|uniref:Uncharacterized protein n=1 Tax=Natronococcus occultus SP4 TaxID=694430 RepID=L0K1Q3_9EURY|nr:hypothetical protein [Natronococcus occultus]AGB38916.1 hypothetical protein Natoc_3177 [Natronococcus occultus SP4]
MEPFVFPALAAVVLLQIPISVLVHFDAKRRKLRYPATYEFGVLVPLCGLVVTVVYLYTRRREGPDPTEEGGRHSEG